MYNVFSVVTLLVLLLMYQWHLFVRLLIDVLFFFGFVQVFAGALVGCTIAYLMGKSV
jgi:hypothetical protein